MLGKKAVIAIFILPWMLTASPVASAERFIIVQSTTSTQNSGLLRFLLPKFTKETSIAVRVVAVGTGQALKNASNGDGDVLLVHAKNAEEKFVTAGYGVKRFDLMYNDFIVVGPKSDPARIFGVKNAVEALTAVAKAKALFASRGDNSGTYKKELALWRLAGVDPKKASGRWYRETGSGMGATLNAAVGMNAYTLTDRATWIAFGNKSQHKIAVQGDNRLFNQYGIILVNPKKHRHVKAKMGQRFIDWMLGPKGQEAIAAFRVKGQQLFIPNAKSVK